MYRVRMCVNKLCTATLPSLDLALLHHQLSDGGGSIFVSFRKASSGVMIAANVFHTAGMSASTLAGSPSALVKSAR